ncbi:GNAT family N-acetyltransferase [uncultured Sphingomonas sp.]|uniref:GNAT family N-acetyltransferase n=1 Tax=uncultured Sphingomonas sp. TaxID=158754 RepID=UPI0035CB1F70
MATRALALRLADARDIAAVEALMRGAFDPRYGEAWTRNQCLGVMALPGVALLMADVDDEPAGFAMTRRVLDEAELLLLAVAPAHRGHGVGDALLRAAVEEAAVGGCVKLHLEVRDGNPATRLYRRHGFAKVGERRGYYRGVDGVLHDAHSYSLAVPA